jgi:hypothetical protein
MRLAFFCELTFPNPNHSPTGFAQRPRDEPITLNIPLKFRQPKFDTRFGRVAKFAARMSMPEATIDEYCDSLFDKDEIGFSENLCVPSPARYPVPSKQLDQSQFCIAISARSDARHDSRTFFSVEDIRHPATATLYFGDAKPTPLGRFAETQYLLHV